MPQSFKKKVSSIQNMTCENCIYSAVESGVEPRCFCHHLHPSTQGEVGKYDFCSNGKWLHEVDEVCYDYLTMYKVIYRRFWKEDYSSNCVKDKISSEHSSLSNVVCKNCIYSDNENNDDLWCTCHHVDCWDEVGKLSFCPSGQWVFVYDEYKAPDVQSFSYIYGFLYRIWSSLI